MKKINFFLIVIAVLSLLTLGLVMYSTGVFSFPEKAPKEKNPQEQYKDEYNDDSYRNIEIQPSVVKDLFRPSNNEEIYTYEFQQTVRKGISLLTEANDYTEDNPLLIINPFGTNSQSIYVYFVTKEPVAVSYTVHTSAQTSAAADFGGYVRASSEQVVNADGSIQEVGNSLVHEFAITGLIPRETNAITINLIDAQGYTRSRRFYVDFPDVVSYDEAKLVSEIGTVELTDPETGEKRIANASDKTLEEGMYAVFPQQNDYAPFLRLYDNDGFMRGEIPLETAYAQKLLFKDGFMYLFVSEKKLVKINHFGEVVKIFRSNDYTFGEDYCFDDKGNILVLASLDSRDTYNDTVVVIDFTDNDIYRLIDMPKLLADYYKYNDEEDWLGLSSISYTGQNMVVLSADRFNTIIKVRRIYNDPRIVYFTGNKALFLTNGVTNYSSLYLKQEGDFDFASTVTVSGYDTYDKIRETRHYLWVLDRNLNYKYQKKEEHFGLYVKYLVDEAENTLRKVEEIRIPELFPESRIEKLDSNILYISGRESVFYEFDDDFNLIARFIFEKPVVEKSIEQQDYEEDNPPPDDSVIYKGISKFSLYDYFFDPEIVVYVTQTE